MKRLGLLVSIFTFLVIFLGFQSTDTAVAQSSQIVDPAQQQQINQQNGVTTGTVINQGPAPLTDAQAQAAVQNAGAPTTEGAVKPKDNGKCGIFGESSITNCISTGVVWIIKNTLLEIAGFLLWLTTNMFDYAVKIGVLGFKEWAPDDLYPLWVMVRQVISLLVIFIGLYLGFMYILGKEDRFQKYIPWVIMFALFVNFSYPLVRTAVDVSNVVSLNIYVSVVGPEALGGTSANTAGALIVNKLGLKGLAASATKEAGSAGNLLGSLNSVPAALLAVCYVLFAAYIFFMVTFLFVLRTAALIFMIVASPLLLVDSVFPMLGEKAKAMRKIFFEQLAVAPVFMIMLALTVRFLDIFSQSGRLGASEFKTGVETVTQATTITTFFNILMMLVLLWIMLKVTKTTAGSIGQYVSDAVGTVGSFTSGAAVGGALAGTGFLARKGIGGLAAKARDSKWVTNNQDTFLGKRAYNLSNAVASSTFDLRNTSVAQKYAGKLGISKGMGAGVKMGYDEESKKEVEALAARSKRIKTRYERDIIKDGKIIARKGDIDPEGMAAMERFHQNSGGAVFLTSKQKEDLASNFIDDRGSSALNEYKKKPTKDDKQAFVGSLNKELEGLQKAGQGSSPKAQALMRAIYDINEQEKEDKKAFDTQLEKEIDRYKATSDNKKQDYLARLDKDMREAVIKATSPEAAKIAQPEAETKSVLTGENLRQERIQKVADGRAKMVNTIEGHIAEDNKKIEELENRKKEIESEYDRKIADLTSSATTSTLVDSYGRPMMSTASQNEINEIARQKNALLKELDNQIESNQQLWGKNSESVLAEEKAKQQASATRAQTFSQNNHLTGPATASSPETSSTNDGGGSVDVFTNNYAQKFAAQRAAKQAAAAQTAQREMASATSTVSNAPGNGSPIPNATTKAPPTPPANQSAYQAQTA